MHKILMGVSMLLLLTNCSGESNNSNKSKPMVYEGMPVNDLNLALGKPDSIHSGGSVFNADLNSTQQIEKWYYNSRTVIIIDDTVKTPNLEER